jgi:hypothetical protein
LTKLIVAFCNFAHTPLKVISVIFCLDFVTCSFFFLGDMLACHSRTDVSSQDHRQRPTSCPVIILSGQSASCIDFFRVQQQSPCSSPSVCPLKQHRFCVSPCVCTHNIRSLTLSLTFAVHRKVFQNARMNLCLWDASFVCCLSSGHKLIQCSQLWELWPDFPRSLILLACRCVPHLVVSLCCF